MTSPTIRSPMQPSSVMSAWIGSSRASAISAAFPAKPISYCAAARPGGLEVYDINNNQLTGAAFIGTVGVDWQFAAARRPRWLGRLRPRGGLRWRRSPSEQAGRHQRGASIHPSNHSSRLIDGGSLPFSNARSTCATKSASILISFSRDHPPTASSPGCTGQSLPHVYGSGLRTRLPFADIEHATREVGLRSAPA